MKRFLIPIGIIASIALIVLSGVLGYFSVNSSFAIPVSLPLVQQATPTPQVRTTRVTQGDVRQVLTVPGEVVPANTQQLAFSASGRLVELNVRVGDEVTQGKVLAILDELDGPCSYGRPHLRRGRTAGAQSLTMPAWFPTHQMIWGSQSK